MIYYECFVENNIDVTGAKYGSSKIVFELERELFGLWIDVFH